MNGNTYDSQTGDCAAECMNGDDVCNLAHHHIQQQTSATLLQSVPHRSIAKWMCIQLHNLSSSLSTLCTHLDDWLSLDSNDWPFAFGSTREQQWQAQVHINWSITTIVIMSTCITGPFSMMASTSGSSVATTSGGKSNSFQKTIKGIIAGRCIWSGQLDAIPSHGWFTFKVASLVVLKYALRFPPSMSKRSCSWTSEVPSLVTLA